MVISLLLWTLAARAVVSSIAAAGAGLALFLSESLPCQLSSDGLFVVSSCITALYHLCLSASRLALFVSLLATQTESPQSGA